jgi:hypothetical protein
MFRIMIDMTQSRILMIDLLPLEATHLIILGIFGVDQPCRRRR